MRGLCGYHKAQVARSAALAHAYWLSALNNASQWSRLGDWRAVHQAYASAFDIARLRLHDAERGILSVFSDAQLVRTLHLWLAVPEGGAAVQEALRFTHNYLHQKQCAPLTCEKRAELAQELDKLAPFMNAASTASPRNFAPMARAVSHLGCGETKH